MLSSQHSIQTVYQLADGLAYKENVGLGGGASVSVVHTRRESQRCNQSILGIIVGILIRTNNSIESLWNCVVVRPGDIHPCGKIEVEVVVMVVVCCNLALVGWSVIYRGRNALL